MNDQQLLKTLRDVDPVPDPEQLLVDEAEASAFLAAVETARHIGPVAHQVSRSRQPWSVVASAAALVLILVGGMALLSRVIGSDSPVAGTAAESIPTTVPDPLVSSPAAAETVVPPSVFDPVSSYRWSLVAFGCCPGGASPDGAMMDVTVGGPGLVAVGSDGSDDDGGDAVVWTSVDGITWSRLPHDEAVFGGGGMGSVTEGGPGLVAVGSGGSFDSGFDAAVWTSADGITWSRLPHDEAVFGGVGELRMGSVTVGGPGLVAVGGAGHQSADSRNDTAGLVDDAAVWTSIDGITWSRVPHDEEIFGGPGEQWMNAVTAGGPGLVAVGFSEGTDETAPTAAVWTSADGITWSRVPHDEAVFGGETYMSGVTVGGPGLVAVGGDGDAVVWTSVDGITWSRVRHDDAVFGGAGDQEPASVIVGGPGLVAVGMEGYTERIEPGSEHSPNGYVPVVWTSVDGITWSRVPHDDEVFGHNRFLTMGSATAGGPGLVVVGTGGVIVAERVSDDAELTVDD